MSAKKIITNLYLGDRHSIPKDADLVIGCAAEIYREQIQKHNIKMIIKNLFELMINIFILTLKIIQFYKS